MAAGCSLFSTSSPGGATTTPAAVQGEADGNGILAGCTEIAVLPDEDGADLSVAVLAHGPIEKTAELTLVKDGKKLGSAVELRTASAEAVFKLGKGQLKGNRFGSLLRDFKVDAAGAYTLRVVLDDSTHEEHFELVEVATTSGRGLGIDPAVPTKTAAIRFLSEAYGEPKVEGDSFWITLPTDLRLETTRVGLLFFRDGELQGKVVQDIELGPVELGTPLRVPLRVWGWPAELPRETVLARDAEWAVHVVQDGQHVTTCPFAVRGGKYDGPLGWSRALQCEPVDGSGVAELAAELGGFAPKGFRAREVVALHRSVEVRALRRQMAASARGSLATLGKSAEAAEQSAAWGKAGVEGQRRAWKREEERQRGNRQAIDRGTAKTAKKYKKLVGKFPEGGPLPE